MNYTLYIDESGHHDLKNINPEYPSFSLCGIIINEPNNTILRTRTLAFKSLHFPGKNVILRSYDIRKCRGDFECFKDDKIRKDLFYDDLNKLITTSDYKVISPVIHKQELVKKYGIDAYPPYNTAITFLLERTIYYLDKQYSPTVKKLNIIFEKRGKKEDIEVQEHVDHLMNHGSRYTTASEFNRYGNNVSFIDKKSDSAGLQLADLIAYPITTHIIHPNRTNQAFEHIKGKLDHKNGVIYGFGIKKFP